MNYQQYYESIRKSIIDYLEDPGVSYINTEVLYAHQIGSATNKVNTVYATFIGNSTNTNNYIQNIWTRYLSVSADMSVSGNMSVNEYLQILDDTDSDYKPSDQTSFSDLDTYYYNTGITLYDSDTGDYYQLSFPGKNGTLAIYNDTVYYSHMVGLIWSGGAIRIHWYDKSSSKAIGSGSAATLFMRLNSLFGGDEIMATGNIGSAWVYMCRLVDNNLALFIEGYNTSATVYTTQVTNIFESVHRADL